MNAERHDRLCALLSRLPEVFNQDELADLSVMGCGIPIEDWYYPKAEQVAEAKVIQLQAAA